MALAEAQQHLEKALRLDQLDDVLDQIRQGMNQLEGLESHEADALRLALLDLELQSQFSASYLPPPGDDVKRFTQLAERVGLPIYKARAMHYDGMFVWGTQNFERGAVQVRAAMEAMLAANDLEGQLHLISTLGLFTSVTGQLEKGVTLMRDGLALHDQLDPARRNLPMMRLNRARLLLRLALNLFDLDHFDEALSGLAEARAIYEGLGRRFGCTTEYAQLYARVGDWPHAEQWALEGMNYGATESDRAYAQTLYGFVLGQQGRISDAIQHLQQSLATVTTIGLEKWQMALASVYLGDLMLAEGEHYDPAQAAHYSEAGFNLGELAYVHYGSIYALVNKARLALIAGDAEKAAQYAVDAANRVRARDTLTLVREEEVLYWEYRALSAAGRDGWPSLAEAFRRLEVAAERIADSAMRESFLERVPIHRQIRDAYHARQIV